MSADSLHARMERWLGTYADDVHRVGYEELVAIWRDATALIATQSDHFADASNMAQGAVNAITFFRCPKCDHYYRVRVTECDCEPGARTFEPITMVPQTPAPQRLAQGDAVVNQSLTTEPPHQDRGEVQQRARAIITDTIGFEFGHGEMQPVNDHDMENLAQAITAALTEAKQQGPGEEKPYQCDFCGARYGGTACCDRRYHYLRAYGDPIKPPQVEAKRQTGIDWPESIVRRVKELPALSVRGAFCFDHDEYEWLREQVMGAKRQTGGDA